MLQSIIYIGKYCEEKYITEFIIFKLQERGIKNYKQRHSIEIGS